ncbi:MAG: 3-carboxy-cis,cis-muconate cycloisomerase [Alphaproteobacteria bacterium]
MPSALFAPLFGSPKVEAALSNAAQIQAMLDMEAVLARVQASLGVIPQTAVGPIVAAAKVDLYDLTRLAADCAIAGNTAIPLVKHLTQQVATNDPDAARFVHYGATSQDVMDTGAVLQWRAVLDLVAADLDRAIAASARLAATHRDTAMAGRTWLQQALPLTYGLKVAGTCDALLRHRERLMEARPRVLALQFGGAVGTLASLGPKGPAVAEALAIELGLAPAAPWHGQRDRVFEIASLMAGIAGSAAKFAGDTALLMQTEIAEVAEPTMPGRGGSSTMPHKRNPMISATILGAAQQVPGLVATLAHAANGEHERAAGSWQSEWTALPDLLRLSAGALHHLVTLLEGLTVDRDRMAANLALTNGLLMAEAVQMALAPHLGRLVAHDRIEAACREAVATKRPLLDVLAEDSAVTVHLDRAALAKALDPATYLGASGAIVDAIVARAAKIAPRA